MIYAFYSFKGGVGRTLAVAHCAWMLAEELAKKPLDILVVDLDMEAPGLDCYFQFPGKEQCKGLIGLMEGWKAAQEPKTWLKDALKKNNYVLSSPELPHLHYLPLGLATNPDHYEELVSFLQQQLGLQDRSAGWPVRANRGFCRDLREAFSTFPYVFLDSRTGLADAAFFSTILLADVLICCLRLSKIHLDGIERVLGSFLLREDRYVNDPSAPYIIAVTPVPMRGGKDIQDWMELFKTQFRRRVAETDEEKRAAANHATKLFRLYEEPFLELGNSDGHEKLLVDKNGKFHPGFDRSVPLVAGYRRLIKSIREFNADKDPYAAKALFEKSRQKYWWKEALYWWERWAWSDSDADRYLFWLVGEGFDDEVLRVAERVIRERPADPMKDPAEGLLKLASSFDEDEFRKHRIQWLSIAKTEAKTQEVKAKSLLLHVKTTREELLLPWSRRREELIGELKEAAELFESLEMQEERTEAFQELTTLQWEMQKYAVALETLVKCSYQFVSKEIADILMAIGATDISARLPAATAEVWFSLGWRKRISSGDKLLFLLDYTEDNQGALREIIDQNPGSEEAWFANLSFTETVTKEIAHQIRQITYMNVIGDVIIYVLFEALFAMPKPVDLFKFHLMQKPNAYSLGCVLHAMAIDRALKNKGFEDVFRLFVQFVEEFQLVVPTLCRPRKMVERLLARVTGDDERLKQQVQQVQDLLTQYQLPPEPQEIPALEAWPVDRLTASLQTLLKLYDKARHLVFSQDGTTSV